MYGIDHIGIGTQRYPNKEQRQREIKTSSDPKKYMYNDRHDAAPSNTRKNALRSSFSPFYSLTQSPKTLIYSFYQRQGFDISL